MIRFYDSQITDILPDNLKSNPYTASLSYALMQANRKVLEYAVNTGIFSVIDVLPENILDILAVELNTQYYDAGKMDIKTKKIIIKNTLNWYGRAGTPNAVQEMINIVFGSGEVIEWFDNGGPPGTFDIATSVTITPDIINELNRLINSVKNVRSHLNNVITSNTAYTSVKAGIGVQLHKKIKLY